MASVAVSIVGMIVQSHCKLLSASVLSSSLARRLESLQLLKHSPWVLDVLV